MSYYRRGYNWESIHYIPAPTQGWNPDAPIHELPSGQAPVLDNFMFRPGKIVARGPMNVSLVGQLGAFAPMNICGYVAASNMLLLTQKTISSTAYVDPWNVPLVLPGSSAVLGTPAHQLKSTSGGAFTQIVPTAYPGPRSTIFNGIVYSISYDPTVDGGGSLYSNGPNTAYVMPNTQVFGSAVSGSGSFSQVYEQRFAPLGALDIKGYQSRIWLLGGTDSPAFPAGSTTHYPNVLYFSNPLVTLTASVTDWQDPVSGLTNKIQMDNNYRDFGVALAHTTNLLLIFRRSSVWSLRGTTTSNYLLTPISKEVGCVDARSVVETDHGVYFMSQKGLMMTNGVTITNVSGGVKYTLQSAIAAEQQAVLSSFGGYITCGLTSQGQILVSIGRNNVVSNAPDGHIAPLWCGMYDPAVNAWMRITSNLWSSDGFLYGTSSVQSGTNLYPGQFFGSPTERLLYTIGDTYLTEVENLSAGRSMALPEYAPNGLYDILAGGGNPYQPIPFNWQTRFASVGINAATRKWSQAKRYFLDHSFSVATTPPTGAWTVTPLNAANGAYDATLQVPLGPTSSFSGSVTGVTPQAFAPVQRINQDFAMELDDLSFQVNWGAGRTPQATFPTGAIIELYGIGIEYQMTRERH